MRTFTLLALLLTACSTDTFEALDGATTNDGGLTDSTEPDAPSVEASGDVISVDANPPFSCKAPPTGSIFCDDFDSVVLVNKGWTSEFISNGGSIVLDNTVSKSAPASMRSTIPAGGGAFVQASLFYEDQAATYQTMSARAVARVNSIDPSESIQLLHLSYGSTGALLTLYQQHVVLAYTDATVDGGFATHDLGAFFTGQWFDFRLDMKPGPSAKIEATVSGVITTVTPQFPAPSSGVRDVELGFSGVGSNSGEMSVNVDDFDYAGF